MRDFPMYMIQQDTSLSESKRDILLRVYADAMWSASNALRDGHRWAARRYAENCRLLANTFGTELSPPVKAIVRRRLREARARHRTTTT